MPKAGANLTKDEHGLTPMQDAYVVHLVTNGGSQVQAARDAGYSERAAQAKSGEMMKLKHIQLAIVRESTKRLNSLIPVGLETIRYLAVHSNSDSVRLSAAQDMLNRAGLRATSELQSDKPLTTKAQYTAILDDIRKALAQRERVLEPDQADELTAIPHDSPVSD